MTNEISVNRDYQQIKGICFCIKTTSLSSKVVVSPRVGVSAISRQAVREKKRTKIVEGVERERRGSAVAARW